MTLYPRLCCSRKFELFLCQYDYAAALRRLIRKRGKLCRVSYFLFRVSVYGDELACLPVSKRDSSCFIQK